MTMLLSQENKKVGKDTLILNMCSSTDCPSKPLGLCQCPDCCYAAKAERDYRPNVLPYRRKQETAWKYLTADEHVGLIKAHIIDSPEPIKWLRFSEAGDFSCPEDIKKMSKIADLMKGILKVYGYTARSDFKEHFKDISENMTVNGSGFMLDNSFTVVAKDADTDTLLKTYDHICYGDCRKCHACKHDFGFKIAVRKH